MKKTTQEIKSQIVNYLTKTSVHIFMNTDGNYFKIVRDDESFQLLKNGKLNPINIDQYINWYGENAKNVLKHRLFDNPNMKCVRNTFKVKEDIRLLVPEKV